MQQGAPWRCDVVADELRFVSVLFLLSGTSIYGHILAAFIAYHQWAVYP